MAEPHSAIRGAHSGSQHPTKQQFEAAITAVRQATREETALRILGRLLTDIERFNQAKHVGCELLWTAACREARDMVRQHGGRRYLEIGGRR